MIRLCLVTNEGRLITILRCSAKYKHTLLWSAYMDHVEPFVFFVLIGRGKFCSSTSSQRALARSFEEAPRSTSEQTARSAYRFPQCITVGGLANQSYFQPPNVSAYIWWSPSALIGSKLNPDCGENNHAPCLLLSSSLYLSLSIFLFYFCISMRIV